MDDLSNKLSSLLSDPEGLNQIKELANSLLGNTETSESQENTLEGKNEIAAIILEPIAANMGVVVAEKAFIQELRDICTKENIVLIFDEVITGFRLGLGGAQEYFQVKDFKRRLMC